MTENIISDFGKKVRVLIVDDSAVVRSILSAELAKQPGIDVVGSAMEPYQARDLIVQKKPDVLTLDVEMPRMDGITFLQKIMQYYPMPVIILSSLTRQGCETAMKALEFGAVEVMHKPSVDLSFKLNEMIVQLSDKIHAAAKAQTRFLLQRKLGPLLPRTTELQMDAMIQTTDVVVAIGASTGGTEAIRRILPVFPPSCPGILITQHMPEKFTQSFAESLDRVSQMEVREAKDGDTVRQGLVLIAPGNYHMFLRRSGARYYVEVKEGPLVCRQRPSVEVLFDSVAKYAGKNALGVILTGMGNDGAQGMLHMKEQGAYTIAQDEASCVVYGMPHEAVKAGAVHKIAPLDEIPERVIRQLTMMAHER